MRISASGLLKFWTAGSSTMKNLQILGTHPQKYSDCKVKTYDFKRPDKFSKDQIRTVSIMHETFARLSSPSLSAKLRNNVQMHVASVDQLTYEEFIRSIPNPTTIAIINMNPLKGSAVIEIDPPVTFSIIDRLLGGQGEPIKLQRDLTHIEHIVIENIITAMLGNLREAWAPVIDIQPALGQIETNPQFAQIVPPAEMIVLVSFEIKITNTAGMVNLCFPYLTIEPIIPRLSAQYWYSSIRKKPGQIPAIKAASLKINSELYVEAEKLSLHDLVNIKKNQMILLPDFHKGIAFLSSGGNTVLNLKKAEKRQIFSVIDDKDSADKVEMFIQTNNLPYKGESPAMEKLMEEPLAKITNMITSTTEKINNRIMEINKKQDELADQLFFQSPEKDIPPENINIVNQNRPFGFIHYPDIDNIYLIICMEHPQTIALILSYTDPKVSSSILAKLPSELQIDVARRIAVMDRVNPEILEGVEVFVAKKLKTIGYYKDKTAGGVESVIGILNLTSREVERNIIDGLEKNNPELAEEIKKRLFVFEDTVLLSGTTIKTILKQSERQDLLYALKGVEDRIKEHFYKNMSGSEIKEFKDSLDKLGPVRLMDIEAAQQRILQKIRIMEENGDIIVARPDELVE
jgi:flagellar motor switch protein FliM